MVNLTTATHTKMPQNLFAAAQTNNYVPVVLVVEDDEDCRLMVKLLLEMWDYRVVEAKNGTEALQIAEKIRPDLILMDVRMPDFDGFDVTRHIRESANIKEVPIVVLSACSEAAYHQTAKAAGANDYLTKPLDFEQLKSTLCKYIPY